VFARENVGRRSSPPFHSLAAKMAALQFLFRERDAEDAAGFK